MAEGAGVEGHTGAKARGVSVEGYAASAFHAVKGRVDDEFELLLLTADGTAAVLWGKEEAAMEGQHPTRTALLVMCYAMAVLGTQ